MDTNLIIKKCEPIIQECAKALNLEIVDVEYVRENGIKILRVIAKGENGLSIEDASELNKTISDKLDEIDFMDEQYYLEVSSEGIERDLRNDKDILDSIGKYVFVKLYEKIDDIKEIYGDLLDYKDMNKTRKQSIEISKNKISKIRLAIKF